MLGNWSIQEAYVSLFFEKDGIGVSLWGYVYAFEILDSFFDLFEIIFKILLTPVHFLYKILSLFTVS